MEGVSLEEHFEGELTLVDSMVIDKALHYLADHHPDTHTVILQICRDRKSVRQLTGNNETERKRIARHLAEGRYFVRGFFACATLHKNTG